MVRGCDVGAAHQIDPARVDDDKFCALPEAALHAAGEDRVRIGGVRANDEDDVSLHDRIEILRTPRLVPNVVFRP